MKTILGFPDYAITKDGRVWSKPRISLRNYSIGGRWIKQTKTGFGHLMVSLCRNGKVYQKLVHQLVLDAFVGPRPDGMECRHLNGNPQDNRLDNLKWGTHSENQKDAVLHGTHVNNRGSRCGTSKLKESDISIIRYLRKVGFKLKDIAWQFNINQSSVSFICLGRTWKHV